MEYESCHNIWHKPPPYAHSFGQSLYSSLLLVNSRPYPTHFPSKLTSKGAGEHSYLPSFPSLHSYFLIFIQSSNTSFLSFSLIQFRDFQVIFQAFHLHLVSIITLLMVITFLFNQIINSLHKLHHLCVTFSNLQVIIQVFLS